MPSPGRATSPLRAAYGWLGRAGIAFLVFLASYAAVEWLAPNGSLKLAIVAGPVFTRLWVAIRLAQRVAKRAIWRLRNRLLVTYLFIAVVPILLILLLAVTGGEFLARQLAVYLVTSELERRIDGLGSAAQSVTRTSPAARPAVIRAMIDLFYEGQYPGIEVLLRTPGRSVHYPLDSTLPAPPDGWPDTKGTLV